MLTYHAYVGRRAETRKENSDYSGAEVIDQSASGYEIITLLDNESNISNISKTLGMTKKKSLNDIVKSGGMVHISNSKAEFTVLNLRFKDGGGQSIKLNHGESIQVMGFSYDENGEIVLTIKPFKITDDKEKHLEFLNQFGINKIGAFIDVKASDFQSIGAFKFKANGQEFDVFGAHKETVLKDNAEKEIDTIRDRWKVSKDNDSFIFAITKKGESVKDGEVFGANIGRKIPFNNVFKNETVDQGVLDLLNNMLDKLSGNIFNNKNQRSHPVTVLKNTLSELGLSPEFIKGFNVVKDSDGNVVKYKGKDLLYINKVSGHISHQIREVSSNRIRNEVDVEIPKY
jgi:hypothetical protein